MHDFSCKFAIHHFRFFAKFSKRADKNSLFISEIGISGVENLIGSQIEIRSRPLPNCHHFLDLGSIPVPNPPEDLRILKSGLISVPQNEVHLRQQLCDLWFQNIKCHCGETEILWCELAILLQHYKSESETHRHCL